MSVRELTGRASMIDGNTLEIRGTRLRLVGIDAFEGHQTCDLDGRLYRCGQQRAPRLADAIGQKGRSRSLPYENETGPRSVRLRRRSSSASLR
jgi:endonuclease YncB( thermonuclease family)